MISFGSRFQVMTDMAVVPLWHFALLLAAQLPQRWKSMETQEDASSAMIHSDTMML